MASLGSVAVVAEDQEFWRTGIASMLKRQLHFSKVVHALSFDQLIDALRSDPTPLLATVALGLPGMQSYAGVRQLREQFPSVRLIVISAMADRETILHSLAAGIHGFIPKHFQGSEILAAMTLIQKGQVFVPPDLPDMPERRESEQDGVHFFNTAGAALTRRQRDVIQLLAEGKSNKEIASILEITEGTVKVHVNAAFRALGVHNRVSAVVALHPKQQ